MTPNGRNNGNGEKRLLLLSTTEDEHGRHETSPSRDVVFDFTGLDNPDVGDLSLILTARLAAGPGDRVWMRGVPAHTLRILRGLGLDHLFRRYPRTPERLN